MFTPVLLSKLNVRETTYVPDPFLKQFVTGWWWKHNISITSGDGVSYHLSNFSASTETLRASTTIFEG